MLARVVGSRAEFKQIIGRGTRLRVDYGKEFFNIIDFTGTATQHFADPLFDGYPVRIEEVMLSEQAEVVATMIGLEQPENGAVPSRTNPRVRRIHQYGVR